MTDTAVADTGVSGAHDEHAKPDFFYVQIAIILAAITGLEVAWSYLDFPTLAEVGGLFLMMAVKFGVVAAYFMHLKFDNKILTRLFYAGLFLAIGVYTIALFTFRIFNI